MSIIKLDHDLKSTSIQSIIENKLKYYFSDIDSLNWSDNQLLIIINKSTKLVEIERYSKELIAEHKRIDQYMSNSVKSLNVQIDSYVENLIRQRLARLIEELTDEEFKDSIIHSYNGVNSYTGNSLMLLSTLNSILTEVATIIYQAKSQKTTSLISKKVIKRCGYLQNGMQSLYFVNEINKDPSILNSYNEMIHLNNTNIIKFQQDTNFVLTPAVCLHLYPQLEDTEFEETDKLHVFDVHGDAFRDEGGNLNNIYRLREFYVHEFVFFGTKQVLENHSYEIISIMVTFLSTLGILDHIEYANDIFFGKNANAQLFSQVLSKSKIEAISSIDTVSLASVNYHKQKFCTEFNIMNKKNKTCDFESMCLGFGMDRILTQISQKYTIASFKVRFK